MGSEMAFNLFSKHHQAHLINNSTANNNGTSSSSSRSDASFVVCDAVPESAQAFARKFLSQFPGANIRIVDTPDQVVLASQTIITMLPSSPQMKEVYTGERGVLSVLNNSKHLSPEQVKSTLCIDSTTLDVDVARQVAEVVTRTGAQMVDAPVSGGVHAASQSTLAFLVGGPHTSYLLSLPYLTLMGSPPKSSTAGIDAGRGLRRSW
ncbi:3-hydroxyisobutyrate dehydrogenase [Pyrrhoderma noxium]|uniref:3-hydroxyisobutyrate dehydrogenase n=1 Tax=Pyrrhoderma noxium TaxID=2282107 RepID=A0A286UVD6_9AGAM|nr:3-hydroxyisobutyrate dehydrogenase [Pyrrhoderma noxium]